MKHKFLSVLLVFTLCFSVCVVPTYAALITDEEHYVYVLEDGTVVDTSEIPDFYAAAGTYEFVCDYQITTTDGQIRYIPSEFIEGGYNVIWLYHKAGGGQFIASKADPAPYIRLEPDSYYKVWVAWGANTAETDVFQFTGSTEEGTTISLTVKESGQTTGGAVSTELDAASSSVYWSNYDVLDSDGNIVHYSDYVEPEPEDPETPEDGTGESVTVDMTETNEILKETNTILMSILFLLGLWGSAVLFKSLIGR